MIAEQIGDAGEIAILSATANATNQNAWIELMKKDLAANHPNIKLVDTVYGDDDDQTSFDKTAALLQTHPNLKGIISPTTVGIAAAARYLSTSDAKGKVALTGLGTPNQMREYVKDGTVTAFALWNPERPRLPRGVRRQGPGRRRHHRRGGRHVQGRQARRVHRRRRRRPSCWATRSCSTRTTSTTSTSESATVRPADAPRRPDRHPAHHPTPPTTTRGVIVRVCFQLQVQPDRLDGVPRAGTRAVWPEMLQALADTGWHNYSLFLRDDGLLIGYVETPVPRRGRRRAWPRTEVNARWQAEMAEFFEDLDGVAARPGLPPARGGLPPRGPARRPTAHRPAHRRARRDHRSDAT